MVMTLGAMFMIPSLITIIGYYMNRSKYSLLFPVGSIGGMFFGLLLMVAPDFFSGFLTIVLGFVVVMGCIQQLATLMAARAYSKVSMGYYLLPILVLISGLVALLNPMHFQHAVLTIIGLCCLVYGVFELLSYFKFTRHRPPVEVSDPGAPLQENGKVIPEDDDIEDAVILEETPLDEQDQE